MRPSTPLVLFLVRKPTTQCRCVRAVNKDTLKLVSLWNRALVHQLQQFIACLRLTKNVIRSRELLWVLVNV